ncbi:MAG: GAF domain-containing protein [Bacteroidales bacterium]|nr:GAF domain-containing protein [Bacteroidales bacterium]
MVNKEEVYKDVVTYISELIEGKNNPSGVLCNVTAALHDALPYYFWVGFYIVEDDTLQLGPFQGPVACFRIKKGRGVCGTSWAEAKSLIVPDVEQFPGHIACSSLSRSEIVVPIIRNDEVIAVIDVDSKELNSFDATDQKHLEQVAEILANTSLL